MPNKFHHIKSDSLARGSHDCEWADCKVQVPRSHTMCEPHWQRLPKPMRDLIWGLYELGQEDDPALVSDQYKDALERVREWTRTWELVNGRRLSQRR